MKKLLSGLLTLVMIVSTITATGLLIARTAFGGNVMGEMLKVALDEVGVESYDEVLEEVLGEEYDSDIEEYFDVDAFEKEFGQLASDYLQYSSGITSDKPDTEKLQELVENAIEKFEDKEDVEIDKTYVDEFFDTLESELEATEIADSEVTQVMSVIYSQGLLIGAIAITIVCLLCIYLLSKDISKTIKRAGIVSIVNGILVLGLGKLIDIALNESLGTTEEIYLDILEVITNLFNTSGIICIVAGIILIVLAVFLKNKQKNEISTTPTE